MNLFTRGPVIHRPHFIRHTAPRESVQVGNAVAASDASVGSDRRGCDNNSAVFLFLCSRVKRQAGWAEAGEVEGVFCRQQLPGGIVMNLVLPNCGPAVAF